MALKLTTANNTSTPQHLDQNNIYSDVNMPNWFEAKAYCDWLAEQSELAFDMPTEAQWEYAARSRGQNVPFATNEGIQAMQSPSATTTVLSG